MSKNKKNIIKSVTKYSLNLHPLNLQNPDANEIHVQVLIIFIINNISYANHCNLFFNITTECYGRLKANDNCFMCPEHKHYVVCQLCFGYIIDMRCFGRITSNFISNRQNMNGDKAKDKLTPKGYLPELYRSINESKIQKLDHIFSNLSCHMRIVKEIEQLIFEFFGMNDDESMRFADHGLLFKFMDGLWDKACAKPEIGDDTHSFFLRDNTIFYKLDMSKKEFEEIKTDDMYKKYVLPNTKQITLNEFEELKYVERLLIESKDTDSKITKRCNRILNILRILDEDKSNDFEFDAMLMKLQNYSYDAHPYWPGGPPQGSGKGECVIFTIQKDTDDVIYFVVKNWQIQLIGM